MEKNLKEKIMLELNENDKFMKSFVSAKDADELQKTLKHYGYDVSLEEIKDINKIGVEGIVNYNNSTRDSELSLDDLENVDGGGVVRGSLRLIASSAAAFGYGAFCGLCPAAYGSAGYVVGGLATWTACGYVKKGW